MGRALCVIGVCAAVGAWGDVRADWPQWRGDAGRSGSTGAPLCAAPSPASLWTLDTGASDAPMTLLELDGDGVPDVVRPEGGRLVARSAFGEPLWATAVLGARRVAVAADLDQDGIDELLVDATSRVLVVDPATGAVEWESPPALRVEHIGALAIVDALEASGLEVLVADTGCDGSFSWLLGPHQIAEYHQYGQPVIVSFAGGFDAPTYQAADPQTGALYVPSWGGVGAVVADLDGAGGLDVVSTGGTVVGAVDLATKQKLVWEEVPGAGPVGKARLVIEPVDGVPTLFVFDDWDAGAAPVPRIRAAQYSPVPPSGYPYYWEPPAGSLTWTWVVGAEVSGAQAMRTPDRPVADLDGDGALEVVASFHGTDGWLTGAWDAATGAMEWTRPGELVLWTAPGDGPGELATIETSSAIAPRVGRVRLLRATPGGPPEPYAVLEEASLLSSPGGGAIALLDADHDGWPDEAVRVAQDGSISPLGKWGRVVAATAQEVDGQLWVAVAGAGGETALLDGGGTLRNDADGDGAGDLLLAGHAAKRVVGRRMGQTTYVLAQAGAGRLTVVDGTPGAPWPTPVLTVTSTSIQVPILLEGAAGPTLVVTERIADTLVVSAVGLSGVSLWSTSLPDAEGRLFVARDPLVADVDGDGGEDVVLCLGDAAAGKRFQLVALHGGTGTLLWQTPFVSAPGRNAGQIAVRGSSLLWAAGGVLRKGTLATGELETVGSVPGGAAALPLVADIASEPGEELLLVGQDRAVSLLSSSGALLWKCSFWRRVASRAAVAQGSDGAVVAVLGRDEPWVKLLDAESGGVLAEVTLAAGQDNPDPAGARRTGNTDVVSAADLDGGPVFVVTATDGWVYALGLDGHRRWAWDAGAPADSPALLDLDGDGQDELLVPLGDGRIAAARPRTIAAPTVVALGSKSGVVPLPKSEDALVEWSLVDGASTYEVRVIDEESGAVVAVGEAEGPPFEVPAEAVGEALHLKATVRSVVEEPLVRAWSEAVESAVLPTENVPPELTVTLSDEVLSGVLPGACPVSVAVSVWNDRPVQLVTELLDPMAVVRVKKSVFGAGGVPGGGWVWSGEVDPCASLPGGLPTGDWAVRVTASDETGATAADQIALLVCWAPSVPSATGGCETHFVLTVEDASQPEWTDVGSVAILDAGGGPGGDAGESKPGAGDAGGDGPGGDAGGGGLGEDASGDGAELGERPVRGGCGSSPGPAGSWLFALGLLTFLGGRRRRLLPVLVLAASSARCLGVPGPGGAGTGGIGADVSAPYDADGPEARGETADTLAARGADSGEGASDGSDSPDSAARGDRDATGHWRLMVESHAPTWRRSPGAVLGPDLIRRAVPIPREQDDGCPAWGWCEVKTSMTILDPALGWFGASGTTAVPPVTELPEAPWLPWTSGHTVAIHEGSLWAVDRENRRVVELDAATAAPLRAFPLPGRPGALVVGPDGRLFGTVRDAGAVVRAEPGKGSAALADVGADPVGLALSPAADVLFVALAGEGTIAVLDPETLGRRATLAPFDRPSAILASAGGWLAVAQRGAWLADFALSPGTGLPDPDSARLTWLRRDAPHDDELFFDRWKHVVANRAGALTDVPGKAAALAVHVQAEPLGSAPAAPVPLSDGYGDLGAPVQRRPLQAAITAIPASPSTKSGPVLDTVTGWPVLYLASQPSDIVHHPVRTLAFVSAAGSDAVLVLNTAGDPMAAPVGLIFVGRAPSGVAVSPDGATLYVNDAQSLTVSRVDLVPLLEKSAQGLNATLRMARQAAAPYGTDPLTLAERNGRRLFTFGFDPRIAADGAAACAWCHPDGLEDGLTWRLGNDKRQTIALAGRLDGTAPYDWLGTKPTLSENIEQTIERLGGTGLSAGALAALGLYLVKRLEPPPNPHLASEGLTTEQAAGLALYTDPVVGCADCHGLDGEPIPVPQDVGTPAGGPSVAFSVPSLRSLFATAPYLHDGSAATLEDVIDLTSGTMGGAGGLTAEERAQLIAYLLTL